MKPQNKAKLTKTVQWNPANPKVVLESPQVNRSGEDNLTFNWKQDGVTIGYGPTIQVAVQQGINRFNVETTDKKAYPYETVTVTIVVIAENDIHSASRE